MENLINLETLATDVIAKLTAVYNGLADLATEAQDALADVAQEYEADTDTEDRPWTVVLADYNLAREISANIASIRDKIAGGRWSNAVKDINEAVANRESAWARVEKNRAEAVAQAARLEAQEAGKTAERVESGFKLISSFTKGKGKGTVAHVLYMVGGTVFEDYAAFDSKTREITTPAENIGYSARNHSTNQREFIFRGDMTAEEIGKAAHIRDRIFAALRAEIGPLKVAA